MRLRGGGWCISDEADAKDSIYYFWERLKEYNSAAEEHKTDVAYYFGQSWHYVTKKIKVVFIKVTISKDLNKDWRQNIKQALKLIKQCAPGLMFEWKIGDKSTIFGANSIYVTTNIIAQYNL